MISIEPVELIICAALATEGAGEQPVASNAGPYVERVIGRGGGTKGDPWCAFQVSDWGIESLGARWPLPVGGSCQALFEWSSKKGLIRTTPERGDVFLIWHPELRRFAHTGLVLAAPNDTISGNTTWPKDKNASDPKLAREGWCVARKPWPFKPADRFIRWHQLLEAA